MSATGLLIVSNVKGIQQSLNAIKKYVKNLYIHLNVPTTVPIPAWTNLISTIYFEGFKRAPNVDVRVLITPLKTYQLQFPRKNIDMLFSDRHLPEVCDKIRSTLNIPRDTIFLADECTECSNIDELSSHAQSVKVYPTVVLGGTFDRIHIGHKIFLSTAVLRACKRLLVGVTDDNMVKTKKLYELILPVETRINHIKEFLSDIDSTLQYEVVPISDPFGPTQSDPDMDLIVVSSETLRGGQKVNEIRLTKNLKELDILSIELIQSELHEENKEQKISSSNNRMDLLGTRIHQKEARPHLSKTPYIIGLTGGIASGKSKMSEVLRSFGAYILDCDKVAHEIYEPGKVCYNKIVQHFGAGILNDEKRIDRRKLGPTVFADPAKLEMLNSIVWPELRIEIKRRIKQAHEKEGVQIVAIEAAILLKAGWETECHEVWSMIVSPNEAIRRVMQRNGLSREDAEKRLASQMDNRSVVQKSNVVFCSEWSPDYTKEQAKKAWQQLTAELNHSS